MPLRLRKRSAKMFVDAVNVAGGYQPVPLAEKRIVLIVFQVQSGVMQDSGVQSQGCSNRFDYGQREDGSNFVAATRYSVAFARAASRSVTMALDL